MYRNTEPIPPPRKTNNNERILRRFAIVRELYVDSILRKDNTFQLHNQKKESRKRVFNVKYCVYVEK